MGASDRPAGIEVDAHADEADRPAALEAVEHLGRAEAEDPEVRAGAGAEVAGQVVVVGVGQLADGADAEGTGLASSATVQPARSSSPTTSAAAERAPAPARTWLPAVQTRA